MRKLLSENLNDFLIESLEKNNTFNGEVDINTGDFIYNEVVIWLINQMKDAGTKFESRKFGSGNVHFDNGQKISVICEINKDHFREGWYVNFKINQDKIFSYIIGSGKFNNRESFKNVLTSGQYANYSISGANIDGKWVSLYFKNFKDLKLKKQCWQSQIKSGDYLKRDINIQWVTLNGKELTYKEVVDLPKEIIKAFKTSILFKNFIKGNDINKLNKKLSGVALKSELSIDTVVNFLESTKVTQISTKQDHSGPFATTGTSEAIDKFDISKLQQKFSETNKFILDNIKEIFKGLEKKKYAHPLGYYRFKNAEIKGSNLEIERSCTTYYN